MAVARGCGSGDTAQQTFGTGYLEQIRRHIWQEIQGPWLLAHHPSQPGHYVRVVCRAAAGCPARHVRRCWERSRAVKASRQARPCIVLRAATTVCELPEIYIRSIGR